MKAKDKIESAINKLVSILGNADGRYSEEEKKDITEAISQLQKYKDSQDKALLTEFVISLLKAFLIHKIFFNDDDNQH